MSKVRIMLFKWGKAILTSTIVVYAVCFLLIWKFLDFPKLRENAVTQTMSRYVPPIEYFKELVYKTKDYDDFKLRWCIDYHRKAAHFFSYQASEAYAMMAFCYERLGDVGKSEEFYLNSAKANSNYFWPYYNLGVLQFKKGRYEKAVENFQKAITKDVKKNMLMLLQSKVYTDVRLSDNPSYNLLESYTRASLNAYVFILESLVRSKQYQKAFELSLFTLKDNLGGEDIFYYYAGTAAFHQQDFSKAVELLQASFQKNPQNPEVLYYLGQSLLMVGENNLSQVFLSRAVEIRQKNGSQIEKILNQGIQFF